MDLGGILDVRAGTCYIFRMDVFLKLGGSLITDKTRPFTPRLEKLDTLALEIARAVADQPDLRLVLGHGSGSFGHEVASKYATRDGVSGGEAWQGFAEVWHQATTLNKMVIDSLCRGGLPAVTVSPLASVTARAGKVVDWDLGPIQSLLQHGLLPVVHGDVILDQELGGTILSTEDLFEHLAVHLHPQRILLAGLEQGVWEDFPARENLIPEITPQSGKWLAGGPGAAEGKDVTGGMGAKVSQMLALAGRMPGLEVLIFSGQEKGAVYRALMGEVLGTRLHC